MDFFQYTTHSAVYFSDRQVGYWSIGREKSEALVLTNSRYKLMVNISTQQAKVIYHYKDIRKSYIKQTGGTANCVNSVILTLIH